MTYAVRRPWPFTSSSLGRKSNVCVSTSATFRKTRKAATNRLGLDILGEEGNKS